MALTKQITKQDFTTTTGSMNNKITHYPCSNRKLLMQK